MSPNDLPQHDECFPDKKGKFKSALHRFIYHNEPAGITDEQEFRQQLADMLAEQKGK